jgi:hypothetical protein
MARTSWGTIGREGSSMPTMRARSPMGRAALRQAWTTAALGATVRGKRSTR